MTASQEMQAEATAPDTVPAPHFKHSDAFATLYFPASQKEQESAPEIEYVPALQLEQIEEPIPA